MIDCHSRVIGVVSFPSVTTIRTMDGVGLCELFWWSVDCLVCLNESGLRSKRDGVRDQVLESINLTPSIGWGSLVSD